MKIVDHLESVVLEITDRCNLHCRHCMNRPDFSNIETEYEKVEYVIKKIVEYGVKKVYLSGGEPLLHKDLFRIILLCDRYKDIEFVFTTNGLLLTEEILNTLEQKSNILLQFSIDGVKQDTYEYTRGKGTFEIFKQKMSLWDKSTIQKGLARTCINKYNYRDIENIYLYCISHKLFPSFIYVDALGNGKENWVDLELSLAEQIWCINTINKLNNKFELPVSPPESPITCNFTQGAGICSLLIRADGRVAPCQFFYDSSVGNIFSDNIADILGHENISHYIELAKKRQAILSKTEKCKQCKIREGCSFGCLGKANELGDIMSYDGLCEHRIITSLCYSNNLIARNKYAKRPNTIVFEEG